MFIILYTVLKFTIGYLSNFYHMYGLEKYENFDIGTLDLCLNINVNINHIYIVPFI